MGVRFGQESVKGRAVQQDRRGAQARSVQAALWLGTIHLPALSVHRPTTTRLPAAWRAQASAAAIYLLYFTFKHRSPSHSFLDRSEQGYRCFRGSLCFCACCKGVFKSS